jgi:hypothetical protein
MAGMEITSFEIVLMVSILLLTFMLMLATNCLVAIIVFAILYHTFMRLRRQECNWLKENAVIGE